jgi:hypothetical protein
MSRDPPNERRIERLKILIHDEIYQCSELELGTPIIAQIRAKLAEKENAIKNKNPQLENNNEALV